MVQSRRDYSLDRLQELSTRVERIGAFLNDEPLCIYATGSYGRLEAWNGSDADLFFLYGSQSPDDELSGMLFIRVASVLIEVTEAMDFPPFSADGQYLEVQYLARMEDALGSPRDDSINAFTARMLLLLESRPVYNSVDYSKLLKEVIGFYFNDFDDHPGDFFPFFLLNDILRFWRTLTLNYEAHRRSIRSIDNPDERNLQKAKSALKNYKLKFSRMATCFSMVAHLASMDSPVTSERIFNLTQLTPRERFDLLAEGSAETQALVESLNRLYDQFLDDVQQDEKVLIASLLDSETRRAKLDSASRFGDELFELITEIAHPDRLRYLLI